MAAPIDPIFLYTNQVALEPSTNIIWVNSEDGWRVEGAGGSSGNSSLLMTIAQIRALPGVLPSNYFQTTDPGQEGFWAFDPLDEASSDNTGTVLVTAGSRRIKRVITNGIVNVDWFGAKNDNSTDNATAFALIEGYLTGLAGDSTTLTFPVGDGYYTTRYLNIPINVNVYMYSTMFYAGNNSQPAMTIGSTAAINFRTNLKISIQRTTISDWTNSGIGLTIINLYESTGLYLDCVSGFTENVRCIGSNGKGFVYNNVFIGRLYDGKIAIKLTNFASGWCNQNQFFGGRFAVQSTTNTTTDRFGIWIDSEDGTYLNNGDNTFHEPSFELNSHAGITTLPIKIVNGSLNKFYNCRNEGNSASSFVFIETSNTSANNKVSVGFSPIIGDVPKISDIGDYPTTILTSASNQVLVNSDAKILVYSSGPLASRITAYDATNTYIENELFWSSSTNATTSKSISAITTVTGGIELVASRGVCVRINTLNNKRFIINKNVISGNGGRTIVRCYDASGTILTGTSPAYVQGLSNSVPTSNSGWGGCYRQGSDQTGQFYIVLNSAVAYMDVIIGGGTAVADIGSFDVYALDGPANVINPFTSKGLYSNIVPTDTTYDTGTIIWNASPTTNTGWIWNGTSWLPFGQPVQTFSSVGSLGAAPSFTPAAGSKTTSGQAGVEAYVNDGSRNRRIALVMNDTDGVGGISIARSSGAAVPFVINDGTDLLRITGGVVKIPNLPVSSLIATDSSSNLVASPFVIPQVLSVTNTINGKIVADTDLYTVPTGKTLTVTGCFIKCTAAISTTLGATVGLGDSVNGSQSIYPAVATGLFVLGKMYQFPTGGLMWSIAAGGVVRLNITVAGAGTSLLYSVTLIGILQ